MIDILLDIVFVFGLLACLAMVVVSAAILGTAVLTIVGTALKASHLLGPERRQAETARRATDHEFLRRLGDGVNKRGVI